MPTSAPDRLSAALLGLEASGLVVVAGWEIVALIGGDTADVTSSIALVVLTAVGAAAVAAFGVATARGRSWGRSGGIVTQLLMLAVALGAVTGPAPAFGFALAVALPAAVGLVLLFAAVRRAGARPR
ncbi:MAG: histidine kinase [Microbacterium sp.]|uniref:histidine kinase n=1 Tax=Microbacterium sp. TaxID=51671 RepID=UPI001AD1FC7E|nr:histidine kinase [Microbacterium sp.]MBN9178478.1 histidine kinase [Microbacterium sp.]